MTFMNIVHKLMKAVHSPRLFLLILLNRSGFFLPDRIYLSWKFYLEMEKSLDLRNPRTFSEKLQWLKLYNRKPEYTVMVDKVEVKKYVAEILGEEYIIPTLGVWDDPDAIDFDALPEQFVLKCNHNSGGGMYICKDKSQMDKQEVVRGLQKGLRENYYLHGREWPYKNVPRKILAERFMEDESGTDLKDYKFFCFNGVAKYCQVIANRSTDECIDFYDRDWHHQEFIGLSPIAHYSPIAHHSPANYMDMLRMADKIASVVKAPFVRVDFYNVKGHIYFGEITFFPLSGFGEFRPQVWNNKLGEDINLSVI